VARSRLLAIDGGGIRGIIPAVALAKLESTTGRLTREIFSFVAGTSTGAIIAAAIAAGIPAADILDLYLIRACEIFRKYPWSTPKRIIYGSMYSTRKLHDLIYSELGSAHDWRLNDSPIDLLIIAKRVPDGIPWYFVRDNPHNSGCTGRLRLADCATASAAAPTYFEPWTIQEDPEPPPDCECVGTLIDGGVGVAGNPVYRACVEAFYYTGGTYRPEETTTVSLGTGRFVAQKQSVGLWSWLEWMLGELLESPGEQQTEIAWRHFPQMSFYRLDVALEEDVARDDIGSVDRLREYGERLANLIDWKAILAGTDTKFRVGYEKNPGPTTRSQEFKVINRARRMPGQ
jgi:Patatin-like phospholipase